MDKILEKSGYIVLVTVIIVGLLLLLRRLRTLALAELRKTLYQDHDPVSYLSMLDSRGLRIVLRKGTIELMRLEGLMYTSDTEATRRSIAALAQRKLPLAEKLDYLERCLSFYLQAGENESALEIYRQIDTLLEKEPDEQLKQIRAEAKLLIDIYVKHDTSRISGLTEKAKHQKGIQLGITEYRIAKLYHYRKDDAEAGKYLTLAAGRLAGTAWQGIINDALQDRSVLERF